MRVLPAALIALFGACSDEAPSSAASALGVLAENAAPEEIVPDGTPPARLLALQQRKHAAGLIAHGAIVEGALAEGDRSDHLSVLEGGHCYRILGVGSDNVEDLDLYFFNPHGVNLQQDPASDRFPTLGIGADICPASPGAYRIQVHMYKGNGAFALGTYRTP